ncbi:MAG: DUF4390 domain-containing protein [Alphaproteobacteria bacterium]|nr:DUF4390 domain-containing protein [Alphaproteobacteria bacterium]
MPCWKSAVPERAVYPHNRLLVAVFACLVWVCLGLFATAVRAEIPVEAVQFRVDRGAEDVSLSVQLRFELPPAVEDALLKGIPVYFAVEADVLRERWYWTDKKVASAARNIRLTVTSYHDDR